MAFKYIIGRSGVGKTHYVLQEIKEALEKKEAHKLILLVPEQYTLQAERDLIKKLNLEGILRVEVLSFSRLVHRVYNEVGGLTKIHINEMGKNMIIRKLLEEHSKSLSVYQKASRQDGFVAKINELITEMKRHDVIPIELNQQLEKLDHAPLLQMKLSDFNLIYDSFNQYLANRYIDTEDQINLLIEKIPQTEFLKGAEIWIDGFHRLTPQTQRIIGELMKKAQQISMTFTLDPTPQAREGDLFSISTNTLGQIKRMAKELNLNEKVIKIETSMTEDNQLTKTSQLKHLEKELYAYPYNPYLYKAEGIEIFVANNLYTEVEQVAINILSLVRDKKYRYQDIAVVSGDPDGYGRIIRRIFKEYKIPYFMDQKREIMDHPIIELILAALDTLIGNFQYKDIFRYLKSGFSDLKKDEYEKLENYVLAYGISGKQWTEAFYKGEKEDIERLNQLREKVVTPFIKFKVKVKKAENVLEITRGLFEFLTDLKIEGKLQDWIDQLKELGHFDYVNENTQIWNTVMEIFDQLSEILGDSSISLKGYRRILESGFSACEIGVIPTTIDQVLIGNIERSRSHDIKALFVVGVNDGILPAIKEDKDILSGNERKLLKEKGFQLEFDDDSRLIEEKFSIYLALTKPSQYLWLSYSMATQEGKALRPSMLIDRFKKLYPKLEIKSELSHGEEYEFDLVASPEATFKHLVERIRLNIDDKEINEFWWDVYCWYHENESWRSKVNMINEGFFHANQVYYIPENKARDLYKTPITASISRLEKFSNCPFSHFITYGLKPTERKEYQLNNPDIGKLFHDSMDEFKNRLEAEGLSWLEIEKPKCDSLVEEVIDDMLDHFENGILQSTHRYQYLVNRLKRISKRALWTLTQHLKRGGFTPLGQEIRFGQGEEIPPIVVELDNGEVIYLEGRIDRVDLLEDEEGRYIKIIDYKSGNKDFSLTDAYFGLQLQLLVYLDAMMNMSNDHKNKTYPGGIFYFKIDDPLIKTTEKAAEFVEKEINSKLKMKGVVLKDLKVIKEIDKDITSYSDIIPVKLNKGEEISKTSNVLSKDDFNDLILHVRHLVKEISWEMLKGNVKIYPCKKGKQVSCQYCLYQGICQFDSSLEDNVYRNIKELKDEEILEKIKGKGDHSDD
ncbi:helicase-exonuclease AddAB subunit AddB [Alkaliphilus transvaalensis]|uniref:helicase-exonuclease AddAB subunit AddB n=1 Tax=Alkaliphilus transvaalensis TaxID=114628 RepID=UPI00047B0884|nr:helicase-exonuclease AddAB subunit AddB [Alkaliphilus transvaalensis]